MLGSGRLLRVFGVGLPLCGASLDAAARGIAQPLELARSGGATGSFGSVRIDEVAGGDLEFTITLDPELGPEADLHEFYFNLVTCAAMGLAVSGSRCNGEPCARPFVLEASPQVKGGAGSEFDFAVSFGSGSGTHGNGSVRVASFVLGAGPPLAPVDVLASPSFTSSGIGVLLAAHVQSTAGASDLATIAVPVPEAQTLLLLLVALTGLAFGGRRTGRTARGDRHSSRSQRWPPGSRRRPRGRTSTPTPRSRSPIACSRTSGGDPQLRETSTGQRV